MMAHLSELSDELSSSRLSLKQAIMFFCLIAAIWKVTKSSSSYNSCQVDCWGMGISAGDGGYLMIYLILWTCFYGLVSMNKKSHVMWQSMLSTAFVTLEFKFQVGTWESPEPEQSQNRAEQSRPEPT